MSEYPEKLYYELRIGVIGHRNLKEKQSVSMAVEQVVAYLDRLFSEEKSVVVNWTINSPLAKGSDRMVARSILKRPNSTLKVYLPFSLDEYRKDFVEADDLAEFNELLDKAQSPLNEVSVNTSGAGSLSRTKGYLHVGYAVANASEILIVVWDGKEAEGEGGTADIVQYALQRGHTILRIDSGNPTKTATMLRASKASESPETGVPAYEELTLPDTANELSANYGHFIQFLNDGRLSKTVYDASIAACVNDLRSLARKTTLPFSRLTPVIEHLVPPYVRANRLAEYYQKRHVYASLAIHILAAVAVTIVVLQVTYYPRIHEIIAFEVIAMLAVLAALKICQQMSWHEKWIDYRFLAEQFRTAMYTVMVQDSSETGSIHQIQTLPFYNKPKSWLNFMITGQVKKVISDNGLSDNFEAVKSFIAQGWIGDQINWHRTNAEKKKRAEHRLHNTVVVLFCITFAMALLHWSNILHNVHGSELLYFIGKLSTFLAITLPAWGAAIHAIGKQMEYDRIAERSARMASSLERLKQDAMDCRTYEDLKHIVRQAVQTVSLETFEWRALISFNSSELVA